MIARIGRSPPNHVIHFRELRYDDVAQYKFYWE